MEYFTNVALGTAMQNNDATAIRVANSRGLDFATLWKGLYAARVFNWDGNDFWLLFFADVARKLSSAESVPNVSNDLIVGRSGDGRPRWRREDWRGGAGAAVDDQEADDDKTLLAGLHWLYDVARRREQRLGRAVVDCGSGAASTARWLGLFGDGAGQFSSALSFTCRGCVPRRSAAPFLSIAASVGQFRRLHRAAIYRGRAASGWTGIRRASWPGMRSVVGRADQTTYESMAQTVFVLRLGSKCQAPLASAALRSLSYRATTSAVKFLVLSSSAANLVWARQARAGWLCFCLQSGRLAPVFGPFFSACRRGLFFGREHDTDLDQAVRLLSGRVVAGGLPPARWGAGAPTRAASNADIAKEASGRGRFL